MLKLTARMAALTCALLTTQLFATNEHTTFNGGIGTANPCNSSFVSASGPVDIVVQTNTEGSSPMVSVHLRFKAEGAANNGDAYKMSFTANATFDAVAGFYDVPFHAVFVGKGSAPNFSTTGSVRVFVNAAGKATGANITSLSSACTQ